MKTIHWVLANFIFLFVVIACGTTGSEEAKGEEPFYDIIATQHNSAVQNFHLYVTDTTEEKLREIYKACKKDYCTKECNIYMYNTPEGFKMEEAYHTGTAEMAKKLAAAEMTKEAYEKWLHQYDAEFYCPLANALVAMSEFSDNGIHRWPYKDWRYREVGCSSGE